MSFKFMNLMFWGIVAIILNILLYSTHFDFYSIIFSIESRCVHIYILYFVFLFLRKLVLHMQTWYFFDFGLRVCVGSIENNLFFPKFASVIPLTLN